VATTTPVAARPAQSNPRSPGRFTLTSGRFYLALVLVALIIGIVSLLIPSTPSYDPWAWIIWGREIVHFSLHTPGGPSWKPLPVIFTTLFAPFGQAAPDMWLAVARAGAFAAVVMVFRLSYRLVRMVGPYFFSTEDETGSGFVGAAIMAGAIAAVGLALTSGYISDNALGYSEGLATAVILIALERALDGHPRQAFTLGFFAALDRPEIWLFWGPYGLYLFWKHPEARKLVIGLFILIPIFWFLPEYWGSGQFFRGVSRAQQPRSNSLAFAHCPFCSELADAAWPTILLRLKIAAAVLIGAVGFILWGVWREPGRPRLRQPRTISQAAAAGLGLLGLVWFVVIAVMTQAGFSGNNRYLVIGSAMVDICGAAAWGWGTLELTALLPRLARRFRGSGAGWRGPTVAAPAIVLAALVFLFVPNWVGANLISIQRTHKALVYQARLRTDAQVIIRKGGGPARLERCGSVMTEGFQVPLVAWYMGEHTDQVEGPPAAGAPPGPAPNVVLQASAHSNSTPLPLLQQWPGTHYTDGGATRAFRLWEHCAT
jgi:hypothetical protein